MTRVRVEPKSCDQGRRKNRAFAFSTTLSTIKTTLSIIKVFHPKTNSVNSVRVKSKLCGQSYQKKGNFMLLAAQRQLNKVILNKTTQ